MSAAERHPDLLAYVAGLLPEPQQADIAAHLRRCDGCRDEERSLRSLRRSLRSTTAPAGGHPSAEDLVAADAGAPRDSLSGHVARCAECRADLEALARVRLGAREERHRERFQRAAADAAPGGEDDAPFRPRGARRIGRSVLAAGLAVSLLGVGWVAFRLRPAARAPEAGPVVLHPVTRGASAARPVVAGSPAWVRLVLPFGAPGGRYETRLQDANGLEIVARTSIVKDGEILEVRFDAPDRPGEYHLAVQSLEAKDAAPLLYPLHVTGRQP
ncbi:MAG TPA: zf-HC2 domain-containing protein [Candidatus Polarisedimenticolia bacterium]|nr:zf-HC2 domain-containing protein [Candidatus Polarisedimenticolia bacterium]